MYLHQNAGLLGGSSARAAIESLRESSILAGIAAVYNCPRNDEQGAKILFEPLRRQAWNGFLPDYHKPSQILSLLAN